MEKELCLNLDNRMISIIHLLKLLTYIDKIFKDYSI